MAPVRKKPSAAKSPGLVRKKSAASKTSAAKTKGSSTRKKPAAAKASGSAQKRPAASVDKKRASKKPRLPKVDVSRPLRKILYIMRGAPGCGKSTVARWLLAKHLSAQGVEWDASAEGAAFSPIARAFVCSTDDYFTDVRDDGSAEYKFDPKRLSQLHQSNQSRCKDAMQLGRTPLFVDNTNTALWEMKAYLKMADQHGYCAMIIGPEQLGPDAAKPEVLLKRCENDKGDRAMGKSIPSEVFERMVNKYEGLPEGTQGVVFDPSAEALQLIRDSKSPYEQPPQPRYAGLDVEVQMLETLGTMKLGSLFWEEPGEGNYRDSDFKDAPLTGSILEARSRGGAWKSGRYWLLPDRLHVTVAFFGTNPASREAAKLQVGNDHDISVRALVFVRGGGLLCAAVDLPDDDSSELKKMAGDEWRPHITLLSAKPWQAKDSTALLIAWEAAAKAKAEAKQAEIAVGAAAQDTLQSNATQLDSTQGSMACETAATTSVELFPSVDLNGKSVDICVLPVNPPQRLDKCRFRLFIW
eukprot:TRINITY_DN31945_c0_g1_i1.p1 TRINITY_DN31945_c0_g1~~TRINITY_DN31945_c0_g1_i1.p1  ORF type:complete len:550 (-),score=98.97 TRINITY_DN31945_c0_g1_i1:50-1624(-)